MVVLSLTLPFPHQKSSSPAAAEEEEEEEGWGEVYSPACPAAASEE